MAWYLQGDSYACCSCKVGCPCAIGGSETLGSDGCSAVQIMDIRNGMIEGTDVGGSIVAAVVDWPGAMMAGDGTGRVYFDADMTVEQRDMLEALIRGRLGGGFSRIPELVPRILSALVAPISKRQAGDRTTKILVGDFGEAVIKPMRSQNGETPTIRGPGGFRDEVELATGMGSWWRDPELRQWEGGGYAEQSVIDWRG